jgi:hypothetical protein
MSTWPPLDDGGTARTAALRTAIGRHLTDGRQFTARDLVWGAAADIAHHVAHSRPAVAHAALEVATAARRHYETLIGGRP